MYCRNCGKAVDGTPFCPHCGTKMEAEPRCPHCGERTNGTPFCPHCGKSQNHSHDHSKLRLKNYLLLLVISAAAVALVALGLQLGNRSSGRPESSEAPTVQQTTSPMVEVILPAPDVFWEEEANVSNQLYTFTLDYTPLDEIREYSSLLVNQYGMELYECDEKEGYGTHRLKHADGPELVISWTCRTDGITEVTVSYDSAIRMDANTQERKTIDTKANQYAQAVALYERRDYASARELFEKMPDYADSSKYLRLIRIRYAGTNIGVGSKVYRADCGLTAHQKRDIDAAAADFYFADTADVLVCNSDVASYYLIGEWNGGSKCYIHFIANDYGCRYNIGSKLSTNYQDTFAINDGTVYVDVVDRWTMTLQLTLLSPDCMEVYTYEKGGNTYILTRQ